jgi:hypothetical protein
MYKCGPPSTSEHRLIIALTLTVARSAIYQGFKGAKPLLYYYYIIYISLYLEETFVAWRKLSFLEETFIKKFLGGNRLLFASLKFDFLS